MAPDKSIDPFFSGDKGQITDFLHGLVNDIERWFYIGLFRLF